MITEFNKDTNEQVKKVLQELNVSRRRARIWYGDIKTGRSWNEENDVTGTIGNSTGVKKIPILVHNVNSLGGPHLLDHCIIRIDDIKSKKTLYKHDNFHVNLVLSRKSVYKKTGKNLEYWANFPNEEKAQRYLDFMTGKRYSK